jgi:hypothetical protein
MRHRFAEVNFQEFAEPRFVTAWICYANILEGSCGLQASN